jgi:hypothetical protein
MGLNLMNQFRHSAGCRSLRAFLFTAALVIAASGIVAHASGAVSFQQIGNVLVMSNASVRLEYNLRAGTTDFYWQNSKKITSFYSGVGLSSGYVKGIGYSNWSYAVSGSNQAVITATGSGVPLMKQYFALDQSNSFLVRVDMVGTNLSANWMGPLVVDATGGVDLGVTNDNRALFVPFDNDHFVSYNSEPMNGSDAGCEVGAFYDNTTRNGLVVGSVTHDTWKTGVFWVGANNRLNNLNVFGGLSSQWTSDVMPHGSVRGNTISSPTVFVGFGPDWRTVMENFAEENALLVPPLTWTNGVPFGWNSWGVTNYQGSMNYADAIAVSDSIHTNLQRFGFTNDGTVYINLDSQGNLSDAQMQGFTAHCHANGQKAGVYWSPFAFWGAANQTTNWMVSGAGNAYDYSHILLRDGNGNFISDDGALALDPTHPGTLENIDYNAARLIGDGADYIKLDFLSHGSLEGVHYDTNVTTGIQAYNEGMQRVLRDLKGRMFVSESIAPLFPYQYGNSRRIACDAQTSEIGNTAYTMNSVSYGWWLGGCLYSYNDPDLMVFDNGPDTNEVQSRLINCAITGLYLNGSILTNAASVRLARLCLTNAAINAVARVGKTFTPVESANGTAAANIFVRQDGSNWCVAVFNYSSVPTNVPVNLGRAGLPAIPYVATNLWDGTVTAVFATMNVSLNAKQAKLFKLGARSPAKLSATVLPGGHGFVLAGSGGFSNGPYTVLASTSVMVPPTNWAVIVSNFFDGNGDFLVTNEAAPNTKAQFYRLELP